MPDNIVGGITHFVKNKYHYKIEFKTGEKANLHILNNHVFRYYMSPSGRFLEYPKPYNPKDVAKIVVKNMNDYGYEPFNQSTLKSVNTHYIIQTRDVKIMFDKATGTIAVFDLRTDKEVFHETKPLSYTNYNSTQVLVQRCDEYFYGGGMQNGRFSHKGEIIDIRNTNEWGDGNVSSPCPFYWSSCGYGVLRNTWQPGRYDFGRNISNCIETIHKEKDFDAYFFISSQPKDILNDYYELTGQPLLMPEYAYYEAYLNAFNRDYWVKATSDTIGAVLFEDGGHYKSYKPQEIGNKIGILESLNGNNNNYQFSARAMIDRYKKYDVPLGWIVPNDGYGCGYGEKNFCDDIQILKDFVEYSRKSGVEVGIWTETNLHPVDPLNPQKSEQDIIKEIGVAKVVAFKCISLSGYSFGLTAAENVAKIFIKETKGNIRPMNIMVNGWAGTQRHSGIWSGNQEGGAWENIQFHIPSFIGASLSGQPIIGSDMDGIFGGGSKEVNIRDYQFKTFTPLQLNMDGWADIPKTPFSYGEDATNINRAYLKLKSILMPYNYSVGYESIHGFPMIRAMFLEFPKETLAYTKESQYQYMWGPSILVAPVYNDVKKMGKLVRDGVYLPDKNQVWIDFMTGEKYQGGKTYDNIPSPLWKIPVFIKEGSILPMTNPNNNPFQIKRDLRIFTLYPQGTSDFTVYEDDGISSDYLKGDYATTKILVTGPPSNQMGHLSVQIYKTNKFYNNMMKLRTTLLQIMASQDIENVNVQINGQSIILSKAENFAQFENLENAYFFKKDFYLNPYLMEYIETKQPFLLIKIEKLDVTTNEIIVKANGFINHGKGKVNFSTMLEKPKNFKVIDNNTTSSSISLIWDQSKEADFYEIERDGVFFSNITDNTYTFEDLVSECKYEFRMRSVFKNIISEWTDAVSGTTLNSLFYLITGVTVKCNLPSQTGQEEYKLTDGNLDCMWHTDWGESGKLKNKYLLLHFDLGDIYELQRAEYLPRTDAGNGTFLVFRYRFSTDGRDWDEYSENIKFSADSLWKTIYFNGEKTRFVEFRVAKTVGDFGSGLQIKFFKIPTTMQIDPRIKLR